MTVGIGLARYYESPSLLGSAALLWRAIRERGPRRRLAGLNRWRDHLRILGDPDLHELHRRIHEILDEARACWTSHDYGEGYLYQGYGRLGFTGLRDTDARLADTDLGSLIAGRDILEIGCNCGFLSLAAADTAKSVRAFDINPFDIKLGIAAAGHLCAANISFSVASFEEFPEEMRYGAILSFANHSTFDGNTTHTLEEFFAKCRRMLRDDGLFLFESHHPGYESADQLAAAKALILRRFTIESEKVITRGTDFDRGRTFLVARPA